MTGNKAAPSSNPIQDRRQGDRLQKDPLVLSAALSAADVPILALDDKGRITLFNKACASLTGYHADEARGLLFGDLLLSSEDARAWRAAFDPIQPGLVPPRSECAWKTRDGGTRLVAAWNTVIAFESGFPTHVVSICMDITELRGLERMVVETGADERRRFGQDLHDGLGQDLTGIALAAGVLKAQLAAQGHAAAASARHIEDLALKAIATTRSVARGLFLAIYGADDLPGHVAVLGRQAEETFGVTCEVEWERGLDLPGEATAKNLYWIVREAVTNAVRHGRPRRIRIRAAREGREARISVRDDGCGLGSVEGIEGMGLEIMKSRAKAIGATLRIANDVEGGVLVECRLPLPISNKRYS